MGCKSYLLSTSFGCRLFITFCCCFKELTNRSEGKKKQQMRSMEQCWLVQLSQLIEIKVSSEECTYDLSECIFSWEQASFSGNRSNKFKKDL